MGSQMILGIAGGGTAAGDLEGTRPGGAAEPVCTGTDSAGTGLVAAFGAITVTVDVFPDPQAVAHNVLAAARTSSIERGERRQSTCGVPYSAVGQAPGSECDCGARWLASHCAVRVRVSVPAPNVGALVTIATATPSGELGSMIPDWRTR